jgi:hypothetical protein
VAWHADCRAQIQENVPKLCTFYHTMHHIPYLLPLQWQG